MSNFIKTTLLIIVLLLISAFTTPPLDELVKRELQPNELRFYREVVSNINRIAWYRINCEEEYLVPVNGPKNYTNWSPIPKYVDELKDYNSAILIVLDEFFCGRYEYGNQIDWSNMLAGNTTPIGIFKILQKDKEHTSSSYLTSDGRKTPMPNGMRFKGAFWLHGGDAVFPAHISHGCVNIPNRYAEKVFEWSDNNTIIVIKRSLK
jgi:hypothetical protein